MTQLSLQFPFKGHEIFDASDIVLFDDILKDPQRFLVPRRVVERGTSHLLSDYGIIARDSELVSWANSVTNYRKGEKEYVKKTFEHIECPDCYYCCAKCHHIDDFELCDNCYHYAVEGGPRPPRQNNNWIRPIETPTTILDRIYEAVMDYMMPRASMISGAEYITVGSTHKNPILLTAQAKVDSFSLTSVITLASSRQLVRKKSVGGNFVSFMPTTDDASAVNDTGIVDLLFHYHYKKNSRGYTSIDWDSSVFLAQSAETGIKVGFPLCYVMDNAIDTTEHEPVAKLRTEFGRLVNPMVHFNMVVSCGILRNDPEMIHALGVHIDTFVRNNMIPDRVEQKITVDPFTGSIAEVNLSSTQTSLAKYNGAETQACHELFGLQINEAKPKLRLRYITSSAVSTLPAKLFKLYLKTAEDFAASALDPQKRIAAHLTKCDSFRVKSRKTSKDLSLDKRNHNTCSCHCLICHNLSAYKTTAALFKQLHKVLNHNSIVELVEPGKYSLAWEDLRLTDQYLGLLIKSTIFHSLSEQRKLSIIKSIFSPTPNDKESKLYVNDISTILHDTGNILRQIEERSHEDAKETRSRLKNKDIRTINLFHDELVFIWNSIKIKPIEIDKNLYQFLEGHTDVPDSKYQLRIPSSNVEVTTWGDTQRHCIGSYAERAVKGDVLLLGVWDTEANEWFGHLSMSPLVTSGFFKTDKDNLKNTCVVNRTARISQFYGKSNCALDEREKMKVTNHIKKRVDQWFKEVAPEPPKPKQLPTYTVTTSANYRVDYGNNNYLGRIRLNDERYY